jgi:hypothetical protein
MVNNSCFAISCPRSQVNDRRSDAGSRRICFVRAATTVSVSLFGTLTSAVKREWRSTRVTMWLFFEPLIRSPSQCPGTARSSTSAGRSRIDTAGGGRKAAAGLDQGGPPRSARSDADFTRFPARAARLGARDDALGADYKLANEGHDTRSIQQYLGHRNITHTVRHTELSPDRFKGFWKD